MKIVAWCELSQLGLGDNIILTESLCYKLEVGVWNWYLPGREGVTRDTTELYYGKSMIQSFCGAWTILHPITPDITMLSVCW